MDTYTVVKVQPSLVVNMRSGYHTGALYCYDAPGPAKSMRTRLGKSNARFGGGASYRILHTQINPMTLEVTTEWFE